MKLDTASSVQTTIPANAARRARAGQEDSQTPSQAMIGKNSSQTTISTTVGSSRTQFQSRSSHSRFTTNVMANPAHSTTKITMAYVLIDKLLKSVILGV